MWSGTAAKRCQRSSSRCERLQLRAQGARVPPGVDPPPVTHGAQHAHAVAAHAHQQLLREAQLRLNDAHLVALAQLGALGRSVHGIVIAAQPVDQVQSQRVAARPTPAPARSRRWPPLVWWRPVATRSRNSAVGVIDACLQHALDLVAAADGRRAARPTAPSCRRRPRARRAWQACDRSVGITANTPMDPVMVFALAMISSAGAAM